MRSGDTQYSLRFAVSEQDLLGAQRLRYHVFVTELGGSGALVDHGARIERDEFDPYYDHLILVDNAVDPASLEHVIGVYRILPGEKAAKFGRFYSEAEYDLSKLKSSGRKLLELGRSCVHPKHRGGKAMYYLWNGLGAYVQDHGIEVLFGVASFHGIDVAALAEPLSYLHQHHLAPDGLRVRVRDEHYQSMDLLPADQITRRAAMLATPALIKAYLRLGGCVGDGAFVDHAFNTTDVCLVMDTAKMNEKQKSLYTKTRASRSSALDLDVMRSVVSQDSK